MEHESVVVLEVGGGHAAAALFDPQSPDATQILRTGLDSSAASKDLLAQFVHLLQQIRIPAKCRLVVALPGPFDYANGVGQYIGVAKFDSLRGVSLRDELFRMVRPTPSAITFVNDADAFGLGATALASLTNERVICLTLGTGVGSSFVDHGTIVSTGAEVPPGGELHRIDIDNRPLEDVVSTRALRRLYLAISGNDISVLEIAQRARNGDQNAQAAFRSTFAALGRALKPWVVKFRATTVVVGGAISDSWDLVHPPFARGLGEEICVSVEKCGNDALAPFIGAARAVGLVPVLPADS